jgi:hypothetical protein
MNSSAYVVSSGNEIMIAVGDWIDVVPNLLPPTNENGLSYEVVSLYNSEVGILVKLDKENYSEVILSPCYIVNNYRKVSYEK